MYLSRLILDRRARTVRRDLSDCQHMHRTVLSAFPDIGRKNTDARQEFGVLHRLDSSRNGTPVLLVQSMEKPDWSRLPTGYLLEDSSIENPAFKKIDEQYGHIAAGDLLVFRLRANPTKKTGTTKKSDIVAGKPKSNGTRIPLKDEAAQIEWLTRKGKDSGFELLTVKTKPELFDAMANDEGTVTGKKAYVKGSQPVKESDTANPLSFSSILYEGRLRVTDRDLLLSAICHGIGSGKAYGFGLLSIAPAR